MAVRETRLLLLLPRGSRSTGGRGGDVFSESDGDDSYGENHSGRREGHREAGRASWRWSRGMSEARLCQYPGRGFQAGGSGRECKGPPWHLREQQGGRGV